MQHSMWLGEDEDPEIDIGKVHRGKTNSSWKAPRIRSGEWRMWKRVTPTRVTPTPPAKAEEDDEKANMGEEEQETKVEAEEKKKEGIEREVLGTRLRRSLTGLFLPVVGKASVNLYGSESAVLSERDRLLSAGCKAIHPYSVFRNIWINLIAFLTLVTIIIIPFGVSFLMEDILSSTGWIMSTVVLDLMFAVDLVLNFFTGNIKDNLEIKDSSQIKRNYLKTWFVPDLLGTLPIDYMLMHGKTLSSENPSIATVVKINKLARVFSLLRLFRFTRLVRYVQHLEEVFDWTKCGITPFLNLIYVVCVTIIMWHCNSCIQFLIQLLLDFPENGWVQTEHFLHFPVGHQYSFSLLRTLSHMGTIGYATSVLPKGTTEIWLTSISILTGAALYVLLLSRMTAVAVGSHGSKRLYKSKYDQCKIYLRHHRMPSELRNRVLDHLYVRFQGKWFDEEQILKDLSESLRQEIMIHVCYPLLMKVPWFSNIEKNATNRLLCLLKFEAVQSEDVVYWKGAIGHKMYLIEKGTLVFGTSGSETQLSDGDYFGGMVPQASGDPRGPPEDPRTPMGTTQGHTRQ
ncbi:potassium/sodium hyperpolarization-activated cyclic nucleotide-gated channel 2-like isoform X2 [Ascaphus truei]|uniref:potassium/sodium hyperpolarization-activated cyclic nucleotide-gated channel 2-like isoform X2 n=1 Tax=Ascaphus truei TaxID=8439 RepID=UPI003F599E1D